MSLLQESGRHCFTGIGDEGGASLAVQIECHRVLGWRTLELRSVDGTPVASLPPKQLDAACGALIDAGLGVPVIDSQIGNWKSDIGDAFDSDLQELDLLARAGQRLQTRMLRIMSYPNKHLGDEAWKSEVVRRLTILTERAAGYGLVLVHENCAGWGGQSLAHTQALLEAIPHPNFQLLFDLGNGPAYGYDAVDWLEHVVSRIGHVHVKDARFGSDGEVHYTHAGEGTCRLAESMAYLHRRGYAGLWSIEPHLALIPHLQQTPDLATDRSGQYLEYARGAMALFDAASATKLEEIAHAV